MEIRCLIMLFCKSSVY